MSFADELRKNYVPKKKEKPLRNDPDYVKSVAAACIKEVKPLLMKEAKYGHTKRAGFLNTNAVEVRIPVGVDKARYTFTQVTYDTEEGKFFGLGVPNMIALHQIFYELRSQCSAEGIHVDHSTGMYNDHYFFFWVGV